MGMRQHDHHTRAFRVIDRSGMTLELSGPQDRLAASEHVRAPPFEMWTKNQIYAAGGKDGSLLALMEVGRRGEQGLRSLRVEPASAVVIAVLVMLPGLPAMRAGGEGGSFGGGSGTLADPYIIEDVWDLQNIIGDLMAHYALGNDIDASATRGWNLGAGFAPLGKSDYHPHGLRGSLDGRNHTITGLYIDRPETDGVGLFGDVDDSASVRNVVLAGCDVTGHAYVGALVGYNNGRVLDCRAEGTVSGERCVGGLVGSVGMGRGVGAGNGGAGTDGTSPPQRYYDVIYGSSFSGNVTATEIEAGGLLGVNDYGIISDSYATANVTGGYSVGGLVGLNTGLVTNSHYPINSTLLNGVHNLTTGGLYEEQYEEWASSGLSLDIAEYNETLVPSGGSYEIGTVQGLRDLLGFADDERLAFRLSSDIDLAADPFLFIPYLAADFDGAGHNVSYLNLDRSFADSLGLFGICWNVAVSNISVVECKVWGHVYAGGLAGYIERGTVSACHAGGNVTGNTTGGLVGCSYSCAISDSYATGSVRGFADVGGLMGVGGYADIIGCHATGDVSGEGYVGGLVGSLWKSSLVDSYATGNVTGSNCVGGLLGYSGASFNNNGRCYAEGDVTGNGTYIGGFVGFNSAYMEDSYATGTVTNSSGTGPYFGGFMGFGWGGGFHNCYSTGAVVDEGAAGPTDRGFAGGVHTDGQSGYMAGCFWDNETSGQSSTAGNATGLSTADMKTRATFAGAGWDLDAVWFMREGVTYPLLRWSDAEPPVAEAGPDQLVGAGVEMTFDGCGSTDDMGIWRYEWSFVDGGDVVLDSDRPTATHRFEDVGAHEVTLNVTDLSGNWDLDTMRVTVADLSPPVAHAGSDLTVDEGTLVTFDGGRSTDDLWIADYTWRLSDGAPVVLHGVAPSYRFDNPGVFVVTLNVSDPSGLWDVDDLTVTVNDITPPLADAGPDRAVEQGTMVTFDGSGSLDNVGVARYTWALTDGTAVILHGVRPTYTFDRPGTFTVVLTVTDDALNSAADGAVVVVRDARAPTAEAGPDRTVDEGTMVTFDGSGSSDNVGIVDYTWTVTGGTAPIVLHGISPSFIAGPPGVYAVALEVADAAGHRATDGMTLTVRDATPPVADAGPDLTVPAGSSVTLDASLSADKVGIAGHTWTFKYDDRPWVLEGVAVAFTFDEGGVYEVALTVTDLSGNTGEDGVVITVVDTGRVTGTVLDEVGRHVEGATIEVIASDGRTCSAKSVENGSFAMDVRHGTFTWRVTKEGHGMISGTSTVSAMGATELDLPALPLRREELRGSSTPLSLIMAIVVITAAVATALVLWTRGSEGATKR